MPEPIDPFAIPDLSDPIWAEASAKQEPEQPIDFQKQANAYLKEWRDEQAPKPKAIPEIWRATQVKVEPSRLFITPRTDYDPEPAEGEPVIGEVTYIDKRPDAKYSFSGKYDKVLLKDIVEISKDEGIDPYVLIATGLQETKLGKLADPHKKNYGPKSGRVFNLESNPLTPKQEKELTSIANQERTELGGEAATRRTQIRKVVQMFRNKERIAKHLYMKKYGRAPTQAEIIQGWQGYGRTKWKKSFGGKTDLLGWRDIPHGIRVLEHISSLKQNQSIRELVESN